MVGRNSQCTSTLHTPPPPCGQTDVRENTTFPLTTYTVGKNPYLVHKNDRTYFRQSNAKGFQSCRKALSNNRHVIICFRYESPSVENDGFPLHPGGRASNSDKFVYFTLDSTQEIYIPSNSQETSLHIYRYVFGLTLLAIVANEWGEWGVNDNF